MGVGSGDLVVVLVEAWLGSAAFERVQDSTKEARRMRSLVNGFFDPERNHLLALETKEFAYAEKVGATATFERNDGTIFLERRRRSGARGFGTRPAGRRRPAGALR